jgi:transketolase C-terminal domain/subunit
MNTATKTDTNWHAKSDSQTRLAFGQALLEIGERETRSVVLSADTQDLLGIRPWIAKHPQRFIEIGIAEQNAIGVASGTPLRLRIRAIHHRTQHGADTK